VSARSQREHDDQPRLLALHSEHGYTSNPGDALPDEPEAIGEAAQRRQTAAAHRRAQDRAFAAYAETRAAIDLVLDSFVASLGSSAGHGVINGVRAVRRSVVALERRL
jgi:hypothetical protein